MRGKVNWAGYRECDWGFLSHEVTYFKGLGITKEDLVDEGVPVISYGQIHSKTNDGMHLRRDLLRYIPRTLTEGNENSRLRRGDIVFADTSEDVDGAGNCILVDTDDEVYAGYHTLVARPKNPNCGAYLARLFQSAAWRSQIQSRICGIKVFSITRKILKGVSVLTPPEESQRQIVAYLDGKTAAIDARVAVLEKKLAAYKRLKASVINRAVTSGLDPKAKLKDSLIDIFGRMPIGWTVRQLKSICTMASGDNLAAEAIGELGAYPVYGGNGQRGWYDKYNVDGTTVIVGRQGALSGNVHLVRGKMWATEHAVITKCSREVVAEYLYYNLGVMKLNRLALKCAAQPGLSVSDVLNQFTVLPPLAEQRAIADYLDAECAKIDKMAELVTREIELYKKLKRSLINEVVTGKRKVA